MRNQSFIKLDVTMVTSKYPKDKKKFPRAPLSQTFSHWITRFASRPHSNKQNCSQMYIITVKQVGLEFEYTQGQFMIPMTCKLICWYPRRELGGNLSTASNMLLAPCASAQSSSCPRSISRTSNVLPSPSNNKWWIPEYQSFVGVNGYIIGSLLT